MHMEILFVTLVLLTTTLHNHNGLMEKGAMPWKFCCEYAFCFIFLEENDLLWVLIINRSCSWDLNMFNTSSAILFFWLVLSSVGYVTEDQLPGQYALVPRQGLTKLLLFCRSKSGMRQAQGIFRVSLRDCNLWMSWLEPAFCSTCWSRSRKVLRCLFFQGEAEAEILVALKSMTELDGICISPG